MFIDPRKITLEDIEEINEFNLWMIKDFFKKAMPAILFTLTMTGVISLLGFFVAG